MAVTITACLLVLLSGRPCVCVSRLMEQHRVTASVLCRLAKEEVVYIAEAKQQEEKIERLKAEAGDEYVIKKQVCGCCTPLYYPPEAFYSLLESFLDDLRSPSFI